MVPVINIRLPCAADQISIVVAALATSGPRARLSAVVKALLIDPFGPTSATVQSVNVPLPVTSAASATSTLMLPVPLLYAVIKPYIVLAVGALVREILTGWPTTHALPVCDAKVCVPVASVRLVVLVPLVPGAFRAVVALAAPANALVFALLADVAAAPALVLALLADVAAAVAALVASTAVALACVANVFISGPIEACATVKACAFAANEALLSVAGLGGVGRAVMVWLIGIK